jgi:hypothetical protein
MYYMQCPVEIKRSNDKFRGPFFNSFDTAWPHHTINSPTSEDGIEFRKPATFQVQYTLSLIVSLSSGDHLRQWTPEARRALRIGGIVFCIVEEHKETAHVFVASKFALLVASRTLRDWITDEPETHNEARTRCKLAQIPCSVCNYGGSPPTLALLG